MDLATRLVELEKRTAQHRELLLTEEAAKTALVLPFFQALGYDVFNPSEVIPEFIADVGTKQGEKVDYALCVDGKVAILVECKPSTVALDRKHADQPYRYFTATQARVAILTNGVVYKFFTDTDRANIMDDKPFFTFSMDAIRRTDPQTLERFSRAQFNIDAIIAEAGRLKLESLVRAEIEREFAQPSDEWVKLIAKRVSTAPLSAAARENYAALIAAAIAGFIRDRVTERLNSALHVADPEPVAIAEGASDDPSAGDGIITTEDEIGGFRIIQAIAARHVDPRRVVIRDSLSYCAVLLDDNNRKTLARLHFNGLTKRYVGTFEGKAETRHPIAELTDLYKLEPQIVARLAELNAAREPAAA